MCGGILRVTGEGRKQNFANEIVQIRGHNPGAYHHPLPSGMSDKSPRPTVAINPHAIRSFWVTQMTIAGLDFAMLPRTFGESEC
jgi:hypothetical protein